MLFSIVNKNYDDCNMNNWISTSFSARPCPGTSIRSLDRGKKSIRCWIRKWLSYSLHGSLGNYLALQINAVYCEELNIVQLWYLFLAVINSCTVRHKGGAIFIHYKCYLSFFINKLYKLKIDGMNWLHCQAPIVNDMLSLAYRQLHA